MQADQEDTPNGVVEAASDQHYAQPKPQKKSKDKKIVSCHSCRRRKLKCDRSDPCGACQARNEGHLCTWEEGQRPEKTNRESLEKLPDLILKLTEDVREVKASNRELLEVVRCKIPDTISEPYEPHKKRWMPSRVAGLLPEGPLLQGLIWHFIYTSASLTGFIDTYQLASEVEQVDQLRQQIEDNDSTLSPNHLALRVSFILACASLAAVNLDATKAQELGLVRISIDAFARELWTNARSLIIYFDSDPFMMGFEITKSALSTAPPSQVDSSSFQLLRLVAIKLLLLLAARSFAVPSEYLKIHLDTISSAIKALFGPSWDDNVPLEERELRWQLSSFLCVLDWTSPGIYHNGNYFLRPAMQIDPPSKVPGVSDDGTNTPTLIDARLLERLGQTRYFLEYALALSNLSRRAEDCILRPGLISPAKAAELCSELDALDNKLSFYQLLGWARGREGSGPGSSVSVSGGGGEGSDGGDKHRVSFQRAPQVQNAYLNLELGLIRFKLFRHETFHLMQGATTPGALQIMCIDACVDACIIVLSQCRSIAMEGPHMANLAAQGMQNTALTDCASTGANGEKEKRPLLGSLRRVIQPASSAALVGQTLLHISQSADGLGLLPPDNHSNPSRPTPLSDLSSYAESSMESSFQYHFANNNGNASWNSRFGREKVSILEWHVCNVMTALEALQSTSPLARYRLDLHQQCM